MTEQQLNAMKLALEALEGLEALLLSMGLTHLIVYGDAEKAITAIHEALALVNKVDQEQPAQTDWEAVAADQALTIALLKAEQPAQDYPDLQDKDPELVEQPAPMIRGDIRDGLVDDEPAHQHIEHCLWARNGNQPCPHVQPAQQQEPVKPDEVGTGCECVNCQEGYGGCQKAQPQYSLEEYDAGLLNDFGGGNVEWWQDYIRAELGRAYEHYQSQMPAQPQQEPVAWINWCAATGKRTVSFECESELASQPLYEGITQNTQAHYSKFHSWFDSELHRQKYTKDHPAYLAAQEAWNAANDAAQHRINRLNAEIEAWKVRFKIAEDALVKINGQEREPVATLWQHGETGRTRITMPGDITDCDARWFKAADLYTSPPAQRKPWAGLTDEDIQEVRENCGITHHAINTIEAKLREKNT